MKVPCIPIYSVINQDLIENYLDAYNDSAPVIFRYCIQTGISIDDVLELTIANAKQIISAGCVTAPPFNKKTSAYDITLDKTTLLKLAVLCENKPDDAYVFSFTEGKKPTRSGFQRMLQRATEKVMSEEAEKITVYSLKKTFVFRNYQKNKDLTEILKITGYSSPCRLRAFLGISAEDNESLNSRAFLLESVKSQKLIEDIKKKLEDLEQELCNPQNSDLFFHESYKNLTVIADYLNNIKKS